MPVPCLKLGRDGETRPGTGDVTLWGRQHMCLRLEHPEAASIIPQPMHPPHPRPSMSSLLQTLPRCSRHFLAAPDTSSTLPQALHTCHPLVHQMTNKPLTTQLIVPSGLDAVPLHSFTSVGDQSRGIEAQNKQSWTAIHITSPTTPARPPCIFPRTQSRPESVNEPRTSAEKRPRTDNIPAKCHKLLLHCSLI